MKPGDTHKMPKGTKGGSHPEHVIMLVTIDEVPDAH